MATKKPVTKPKGPMVRLDKHTGISPTVGRTQFNPRLPLTLVVSGGGGATESSDDGFMAKVGRYVQRQRVAGGGVGTDILILIGREREGVHSAVVGAHSAYFRSIMQREEPPLTVQLCQQNGVEVKPLRKALDFMYDGRVTVTIDVVPGILRVADVLQVNELQRILESYIRLVATEISWLCTCVNIVHSASTSFETRRFVLQRAAHEFRTLHVSGRIKSLSADSLCALLGHDNLTVYTEDEVFDAAVGWLEFYPDEARSNAERIMERIRFGQMNTANKLICLKRARESPLCNVLLPLIQSRLAEADWLLTCRETGQTDMHTVGGDKPRRGQRPVRTEGRNDPFISGQVQTVSEIERELRATKMAKSDFHEDAIEFPPVFDDERSSPQTIESSTPNANREVLARYHNDNERPSASIPRSPLTVESSTPNANREVLARYQNDKERPSASIPRSPLTVESSTPNANREVLASNDNERPSASIPRSPLTVESSTPNANREVLARYRNDNEHPSGSIPRSPLTVESSTPNANKEVLARYRNDNERPSASSSSRSPLTVESSTPNANKEEMARTNRSNYDRQSSSSAKSPLTVESSTPVANMEELARPPTITSNKQQRYTTSTDQLGRISITSHTSFRFVTNADTAPTANKKTPHSCVFPPPQNNGSSETLIGSYADDSQPFKITVDRKPPSKRA